MTLFILANPAVRDRASAAIYAAEPGTVVRLGPKTRSLEQNAKMWAMLQDLSNQVLWPVDGTMRRLTKEEWKLVCTAGLRKGQSVAQGIEGGFVLLGEPTSKMTVADMKALIDFIEYFGATRDPQVQWTDSND